MPDDIATPEMAHAFGARGHGDRRFGDCCIDGWFGGPPLYSQKKGHPRLRMRHRAYAIGTIESDEWMLCMTQALTEQVTDAAFRDTLINTFAQMANHLINTDGSHSCTA